MHQVPALHAQLWAALVLWADCPAPGHSFSPTGCVGTAAVGCRRPLPFFPLPFLPLPLLPLPLLPLPSLPLPSLRPPWGCRPRPVAGRRPHPHSCRPPGLARRSQSAGEEGQHLVIWMAGCGLLPSAPGAWQDQDMGCCLRHRGLARHSRPMQTVFPASLRKAGQIKAGQRKHTHVLEELALQVSHHDAVVGGVRDEQAAARQVGGHLACVDERVGRMIGL